MWLLWWVSLALASTGLDDIRELVLQGEHIDPSGVSAKAGELPDYGFLGSVALKAQCRLWMQLEDGVPIAITHEDCPENLRPAIETSLWTSEWQKTNTPEFNGWLPLNLSHYRDDQAPQGVRATFRPARLQEVLKKVIPKDPGGEEEVCRVIVSVSEKGKPAEVQVNDCSQLKADATYKALKQWRWSPVSIGGESFGFQARFVIKL